MAPQDQTDIQIKQKARAGFRILCPECEKLWERQQAQLKRKRMYNHKTQMCKYMCLILKQKNNSLKR